MLRNFCAHLLRRSRKLSTGTTDAPRSEVAGSIRINELLRPLGLVHELRGAFRVDQSCWGVGSLFREGAGDFSDREVEFLAAVTAALAAATPAAAAWLHSLEEAAPGQFSMVLHALVAQARAATGGTARARMRDVDFGWVILQASRLITGDDPQQMVVTVEPATTRQLLALLLSAYGLTPREQEVCLELMAGSPGPDIARHLFISPHTVHDHLKSIFDKVGVNSRGELVARLTATG